MYAWEIWNPNKNFILPVSKLKPFQAKELSLLLANPLNQRTITSAWNCFKQKNYHFHLQLFQEKELSPLLAMSSDYVYAVLNRLGHQPHGGSSQIIAAVNDNKCWEMHTHTKIWQEITVCRRSSCSKVQQGWCGQSFEESCDTHPPTLCIHSWRAGWEGGWKEVG